MNVYSRRRQMNNLMLSLYKNDRQSRSLSTCTTVLILVDRTVLYVQRDWLVSACMAAAASIMEMDGTITTKNKKRFQFAVSVSGDRPLAVPKQLEIDMIPNLHVWNKSRKKGCLLSHGANIIYIFHILYKCLSRTK